MARRSGMIHILDLATYEAGEDEKFIVHVQSGPPCKPPEGMVWHYVLGRFVPASWAHKKMWVDESKVFENENENGVEFKNRSKGERASVKKGGERRWPRNKAERRMNQEALWGGKENLEQFETMEMKSTTGKTISYYIKKDSHGRILRIVDIGEDAPEGYYAQSSRYYALKRNARIARSCSTDEQRALWFATLPHMKGTGGFLDLLGNRGLIRRIDRKYVEMNFGRSAKGRRFMDMDETYFPREGIGEGRSRLKKPRYTLIIEQVRIRAGAWEACHQ